MSGIAGLLLGPEQVVEPEALDAMAQQLAHRGRDGGATWCRGPVGLAHQTTWTTPEARHEGQPLELPGEDLVVCADMRLDHREELLERLGLAGSEARAQGDAELIGRAYRRWGEACVTHLHGDFAFALWDDRLRRLFCARDPLGVRPFYYHRAMGLYAFASEIKGLLALPRVPRRLNELRVACFLYNDSQDQEATFYSDILRLPAGHSMTVDGSTLRLDRYFALDPLRKLPPAGDRVYEQEFGELFTRAVRSRLRSCVPVGAMLSGGMDSSSIACVARDLQAVQGGGPLPTFSVVFEGIPEADERSFAEAVIAGGGMTPHFIRGDLLSPLGDLDEIHQDLDEAFQGGNLYLNRAIYLRARQEGVGALLDGFDGDTVVGYGFERLTELARRGRFLALGIELRQIGRVLEQPSWPFFKSLVLAPLIRDLRRATPQPVKAAWRALRRRGEPQSASLAPFSVLDRPFAERVGLLDHLRDLQVRNAPPTRGVGAPQQFSTMASGLFPASFEMLDRLAARIGVEGRYPFFDPALVEFCLALPPSQKLRQGWTRSILRRSVPSLPEEVRRRGWKTRLGTSFSRGLIGFEQGLLERVLLLDDTPLRPFVDLTRLRALHARYRERLKPSDAFEICKVAALARWLAASDFEGS